MAHVSEVAPDLYRISLYVPDFNLQFNHFLVKDEEPLLFHTGYNWMFSELHEAVAKVIDPKSLRWISFSHFESDECGSLNKWLEAAPSATPACNMLGAILNVKDFAIREPRVLSEEDALETGTYRFRFCSTAHIPHGWDSCVLFEESTRTLFSSDLFLHNGEVEPLTESDIVERAGKALRDMQGTPFAYSVPYTPQTESIFEKLAKLEPLTIAAMHGSSFRGDGAGALRDMSKVIKEVMGEIDMTSASL